MAKRRYTPETIIRKLREAEVLQGQGKTIAEVVKQLGVTEQTLCRWRKEYGGMRVDQAKRLKELEAENAPQTGCGGSHRGQTDPLGSGRRTMLSRPEDGTPWSTSKPGWAISSGVSAGS